MISGRLGKQGRLLLRSNQEWAVDFACDALATGRGIRILAIVDASTRECLTLEVDTSLSSQRVTRALEQAIEQRGLPESIRCDNGPELIARSLANHLSRDSKLSHRVRDQLCDEAAGPGKAADIASKRLSQGACLGQLSEPSQKEDESKTPPHRLQLFPNETGAASKDQVAQKTKSHKSCEKSKS